MALSFIQATSQKTPIGSPSAIATCAVPTSATNGDMLIMSLTVLNPNAITGTPVGWGLVTGESAGNTVGVWVRTFFREASSEPANYSLTLTSATHWTTSMLCIRGAATSASAIDAARGWQSGTTSVITIPSFSPGTLSGMQIAVVGRQGSTTAPDQWKFAADWTVGTNVLDAQASMAVAFRINTASGATAASNLTASDSVANSFWQTYTFGIIAADSVAATTIWAFSMGLMNVGR
jgi:hypothetical protein